MFWDFIIKHNNILQNTKSSYNSTISYLNPLLLIRNGSDEVFSLFGTARGQESGCLEKKNSPDDAKQRILDDELSQISVQRDR